MPKKDKNKRLKSYTRNPVLMVGLTMVLPLVGYFGYQKYLDWENRQLIEGMAEDFPALIAGAEEAISYPLEISSECMQTQEKFSEGVSLCSLTVGLSEETSESIKFENLISYMEKQELGFKKSDIGENKQGYKYTYKDKKTCGVLYERRVYIDCAFGIREPNKPLAAELFNEELLNQKKKEVLKR